ncbi:hypothetical protein KY285_002921 [Solanum tuberosum]|nr:hypothetical protein KY285_002921 [Solanum tuberosum]
MKHQASADRCDPLRSHVLGCPHWTELRPKLINISFLVLKPYISSSFSLGVSVSLSSLCPALSTLTYVILRVLMFSAVSTGPNPQHKLITHPSLGVQALHLFFLLPRPICVTPDISDPSHSHVLSCQHWTRAVIKLIITPFLLLSAQATSLLHLSPHFVGLYWEVVHILNCACAHEAPSNSSICDPSAFSCSRHELQPKLINTHFLVLSWIIQLVA